MDDFLSVHFKIFLTNRITNKYNFKSNNGYGVKAHLHALRNLGVSPIHRRSFKPIHNILC